LVQELQRDPATIQTYVENAIFLFLCSVCVCVCVCVYIHGFTPHSTQNRSFLIRSSRPISWQSTKNRPTKAETTKANNTRMWANAQRDGRPAEHRDYPRRGVVTWQLGDVGFDPFDERLHCCHLRFHTTASRQHFRVIWRLFDWPITQHFDLMTLGLLRLTWCIVQTS